MVSVLGFDHYPYITWPKVSQILGPSLLVPLGLRPNLIKYTWAKFSFKLVWTFGRKSEDWSEKGRRKDCTLQSWGNDHKWWERKLKSNTTGRNFSRYTLIYRRKKYSCKRYVRTVQVESGTFRDRLWGWLYILNPWEKYDPNHSRGLFWKFNQRIFQFFALGHAAWLWYKN